MVRAMPTSASAFLLCGSLLAASSIPALAQVSEPDSGLASGLVSAPVSAPDSGSARRAGTLPPLTLPLRTRLWMQASADPVAWLMPGFDAALALAHPPRQQPAAWNTGDFAGLYGGYLARQSAATAAQTAVAALLREDPRYRRLGNGSLVHRAGYAAGATLVDWRSGTRRMPAVSSLAAAATAAALANTWVAPRFQNTTHLTQRMLTSLAALAGSALAAEFRPDALRLTRRAGHALVAVAKSRRRGLSTAESQPVRSFGRGGV